MAIAAQQFFVGGGDHACQVISGPAGVVPGWISRRRYGVL